MYLFIYRFTILLDNNISIIRNGLLPGLDMAEAMMDYAEIYGWNVKFNKINDHAALKTLLKESIIRNLLLYCEYPENAMAVVRMVSIVPR